jgi:hypothetical protein
VWTTPTGHAPTEPAGAGEVARRPQLRIVWRQDDNDNRFELARRASRPEVDDLAAAMEARGHKQTYWVAAAD